MTDVMGSQPHMPQLPLTAEPSANLPLDPFGFPPLSTPLPADAVRQWSMARRSRRGALAMVGVALGGLVLVLVVVGLQSGSKTRQLTEPQLVAGDCLTGSNMGLGTQSAWPYTVTAVPCTQQHIGEVYYVGYPWPASLTTYPGDGAVNSTINAACSTAFATYVGISPALSMYTYDEIGPSGDWASGDREVVCVAYEPGTTPLHRSIKGAGQ